MRTRGSTKRGRSGTEERLTAARQSYARIQKTLAQVGKKRSSVTYPQPGQWSETSVMLDTLTPVAESTAPGFPRAL